MTPIPPIPRRPTLADHSVVELSALLLYAAMAGDAGTARLLARLIRERLTTGKGAAANGR